MTIKLFIWFIYPVIEALVQAFLQIHKNWKPNYLQLFIIRGFFAIVYGGAILNVQYDVNQFLGWLGWTTSTFFLIFDPLLNFLKGKKFGYTGKNSGWINKIINGKLGLYIIFYIICVIISIFSYLLFGNFIYFT